MARVTSSRHLAASVWAKGVAGVRLRVPSGFAAFESRDGHSVYYAKGPDGRAILYVQEDQVNSDIVLVGNFR